MALTMWGQVAIQATAPGEDPIQIGSEWVDTSGTPTLKLCTGVSPYTFAAITGASTNALLDGSAHTDTAAGTVARGDVITGQGATPKWTRLAKGAANTYLGSDGTDLAFAVPPGIAGVSRCVAFHNTTQTVNAAATAALLLNSEDLDTDTMHDNTTNNSRVVVPTTGGYLINGQTRVALGAGTDGRATITIKKNGTTVMATNEVAIQSSTNPNPSVEVSCVLALTATDYVEIVVTSTTNNINYGSATRGLSTTLSVVRLW